MGTEKTRQFSTLAEASAFADGLKTASQGDVHNVTVYDFSPIWYYQVGPTCVRVRWIDEDSAKLD